MSNDNEYLELCNDLKKQYEELEKNRKEIIDEVIYFKKEISSIYGIIRIIDELMSKEPILNTSLIDIVENLRSRLSDIFEKKILLLKDDECDHYSIDTDKPPRDPNGKFEEEYDPTKINGLIRKLLQCFSRRVYIGYTATPFANILVHDEKIHKDYGEDIFPKSFIYDIEPPPNHQFYMVFFHQLKYYLKFYLLLH